jgi:hypothetical protein
MELTGAALLHIQFAACAFLTRIIWMVKLILYPAFLYIEPERFNELHSLHSFRITFLVGPMMAIELVSAAFLTLREPTHWIWWLNLVQSC